ncbi:hypothetical protein A2765_02920 [Candidatus Kaiserbacteria bacterium RIFCSPHIGHO2_01_FULL_56_24]|uniref:L-lactate permease n=1 Tax=Candidatus Kaiserbacteria bacterium RIFCSPHIGHO2_01_FULL_56_24 TaxID=1798487 RepID=A0A1F6DG30_9BACT|nr:MAG: hypothetical protein A2765_02920 [Candidatus Kaiserbacteria bacterium RIFCSPHIGHO2_01_FULL_56_24]
MQIIIENLKFFLVDSWPFVAAIAVPAFFLGWRIPNSGIGAILGYVIVFVFGIFALPFLMQNGPTGQGMLAYMMPLIVPLYFVPAYILGWLGQMVRDTLIRT